MERHLHRRGRSALAAASVVALAAGVVACGSDSGGGAGSSSGGSKAGDAVKLGLITKTETNPFFVKMKEGADKAGTSDGASVQSFAAKKDGDNESQVAAVENLIAAGAEGLMITPNDSKAIVPSLDKARQAGLLVVALDTQTEPADAADITYATDNYAAGLAIGKWAKGTFDKDGKQAKIAMLDLNPDGVSVDVPRDQGFLEGFGVDVADKTKIGDEKDPRIVGHDVTDGAEEGGRTAMENLLQKDPTINLVYTINEPAAAGAYEALKAAGKEKDVTIVSVDGGCPGVANVKQGMFGATSQQLSAQDGRRGREGHRRVRQGRDQAAADRRQELRRH